jgi:hypothetical protein
VTGLWRAFNDLCEIDFYKILLYNRKKMGEIYMAINIINSKKYIGQAVSNLSNGKKCK